MVGGQAENNNLLEPESVTFGHLASMGRGRRNFPFRPPQELKWNSPHDSGVYLTEKCIHIHSSKFFIRGPRNLQYTILGP